MCPPGKWCEPNSDLKKVELICSAGFICTGGKDFVFLLSSCLLIFTDISDRDSDTLRPKMIGPACYICLSGKGRFSIFSFSLIWKNI